MLGGRKLLIALKTKQVDSSEMFYTCLHVCGQIRTAHYLVHVASSINSSLILFFFSVSSGGTAIPETSSLARAEWKGGDEGSKLPPGSEGGT